MEVRIKVSNELLYLIWDVMIFHNSRNEIVMDLPKSIFEIKKCNHNRPLFHAGFVDDMCHMGCMFERTRKFRHKTFLNTMFYIVGHTERPHWEMVFTLCRQLVLDQNLMQKTMVPTDF